MTTLPEKTTVLIKETETESYQYKDIPMPVPGEGEVLLKVTRVSICGSDINLYKWNDVAQVIAKLPFVPGHEATGEVAQLGPTGCEQLTVGDRVCVENHFYCGECYQCTHNLQHICKQMGQFGHGKQTMWGGCAKYCIVPARYCYKLQTAISDDLACLLEPCGVAHHAVEEVQARDDTVLIIGCGAIGLMCVAMAKAQGAKLVLVASRTQTKLQTAKQMGADVLIDSTDGPDHVRAEVLKHTNNDGVGRLIECSGASVMVNASFSFLRKGARILMLGLPKQPLHVVNVLPDVIFKSITMITIHGRKIFHTWEQCEQLVFSGVVDINPVISHTIAMSEFETAFKVLIAGDAMKILIDPTK